MGLFRRAFAGHRWLAAVTGVIALGAVGLGAGAAYGYFRSSGTGSGTASTGTMSAVTLAAITSETPNTHLLPGQSGEVILKVTNPNSSQVHLVSVVANGSIGVSGGSGCTLANSGVTFTNQPSLSVAIPGGASNYLVRLPGAASMASSSASGCQGATFNIPVTITVTQP